jgi:hypothetical protein
MCFHATTITAIIASTISRISKKLQIMNLIRSKSCFVGNLNVL